MATQHIHQFPAEDMPEIRRIRSDFLKAFKFRAKAERLDKITKAIVSDVDGSKLGLNSYELEEFEDELARINGLISNFRDSLKEDLQGVLLTVEACSLDCAIAVPGKDHLTEIAREMAVKYHSRNTKSGRRHRRNAKSSKKPSKDKPTVVLPTHSAPKSPPKSPDSFQPKSPTITADPVQSKRGRQSPPKPATKAGNLSQKPKTTASTKSSTTNRSSKVKQPPQSRFQASTNFSSQSTLQTFFKVSKPNVPQPSSKPAQSSKPRSKHSISNPLHSSKSNKLFTI